MSKIRFPYIDRRSVLKGIAATGAASGLAFSPFRNFARAAGMVHLRLMETTDVHVHVFPYDYYRDREDDKVGIAKTASLLKAARAEVPNSLLFDNGDFLQGNPMGDYMAYERGLKEGDVHPMIKGMNALKIDVATLGNHEFNYGLSFLDKAMAGADFPFVLSNVARGRTLATNPRDDTTLVPPYVILERTVVDGDGNELPIKIGVIGFTPPQIMNWDRRHLEGNVSARDMVAAARAFVPEMKERGADIVIALSHAGIDVDAPAEDAENASMHVAGVPGIDAVLTGHAHQVFPGDPFRGLAGIDVDAGTLNGTPAVMPGFWGSHLGVIDLGLQRDAGEWRVVRHQSQSQPIYERDGRKTVPLVDAQADVLAAVEEDHKATLAYVRRAVGKTAAPVNSYFALVADDPSVQIVSQAQMWYVADILKGGDYGGLPVLSAAAPFKAGGRGGADYYTDVPAGDIAIKNVADLYLYPNTVRAVLMDGEGVRQWLERSAGMFNRIEPGSGEQALLNAGFPSYNFDVIDGVTYKIDLTQPARYDEDGTLVNPDASRIVDLRYQGAPIDPKQQFVVATNNYRASGGGKFPGMDGTNIILSAPDTNRDVIVRYIVETGTINPSADSNWSFKPIPGAQNVVFESSPKGQDYLDAVPQVSYMGPGEEGFARYKLEMTE